MKYSSVSPCYSVERRREKQYSLHSDRVMIYKTNNGEGECGTRGSLNKPQPWHLILSIVYMDTILSAATLFIILNIIRSHANRSHVLRRSDVSSVCGTGNRRLNTMKDRGGGREWSPVERSQDRSSLKLTFSGRDRTKEKSFSRGQFRFSPFLFFLFLFSLQISLILTRSREKKFSPYPRG